MKSPRRDASGVEVDRVVETGEEFIPVEVKWTDSPTTQDAKHLLTFLREYKDTDKKATNGNIICQTPRPVKINDQVVALLWSCVGEVFKSVR